MKINLSRLTTKNLATLVQRILAVSESGKHSVVENHPLSVQLHIAYQEYDKAYSKNTYSGKGITVAEADEQRDRAYSALKAFLYGYQMLSTAPNADKAQALYQTLISFGNDVDRLNYAEETDQLKKLIEALSTEEHTEAINLLGIQTAFADLRDKQQAFETLYLEQAQANAELRKLPSATSLRRGLEIHLRTYLDFLSAMKSVSGWEGTYAEINELVKDARQSTLLPRKKENNGE